MEATAKLKYLRMSPRKVKLVVDLIRGKRIDKAIESLAFLRKKAAKPISELLNAAAANAKLKEGMDTDTLYVSSVQVDRGPKMKRFMPRAMGRANRIEKKTCHVNLVLKDNIKKIISKDKIDSPVAEGEALKSVKSSNKTISKKQN